MTNLPGYNMNWSEIRLDESDNFRSLEDAALVRLSEFAIDNVDLSLLIDALGLTDALQRRTQK